MMTDQELIDTIKAATDYEENIALKMLLTMAGERIESLTASVYGLYELERENAELIEALQQIIDLPEDSRIHYKVAKKALARAGVK